MASLNRDVVAPGIGQCHSEIQMKTDPQMPGIAQIQALRKQLARQPENGPAWLQLAQLLSRGIPGDELHRAIEKSVQLLPDHEAAWLLAIKARQARHGAVAAQEWIKRVVQQNPGLAGPELANAYFRSTGDPAGALALVKKIITRFPGDARAHSLLSEIRLVQGRAGAAIEAANRALQLNAKLSSARAIRAEAYRQSGLWIEALADFQEVEKRQPQNPILLNKIGTCLVRLEKFDSAAGYFEKALQLNPDYTVAKLNIGLLCAARSDPDEAISRIGKALDEPLIDGAIRQSAQTTLDILIENRRLKPFLEQAVATGDVRELQLALDASPAALRQPHQASVKQLWEYAALCGDLHLEPSDFSYRSDTQHLAFIEACAQCKVDGDARALAAIYLALVKNSADPATINGGRKIQNAWCAIRERRDHDLKFLQQNQGEAWLRYWHARLLDQNPEKYPGQFKAIPNVMGGQHNKEPTPTEGVAGTIRLLLAEIWPSVTDGLNGAVFLNLAINILHGFNDVGRRARRSGRHRDSIGMA
jgi:tetratricopeptide (TPR) repeat protein